MKASPALEREAERQQWLLRALWRDVDAVRSCADWLRDTAPCQQRGLQAYRINAAASAQRALGSAYPTVAALVGKESFGALARDLWRHHPPEHGDLGEWGAALPAFIAASAQLDWLVHRASRAADAPLAPPALDALASQPPQALRVQLQPGLAVLASAWPVASIWLAHQDSEADAGDRFAGVRAALTAGRGENALVRRDDFAVRVDALAADAATFTRALLDGATLADALDSAGEAFAFDQWLVQALRQRWLLAVQPLRSPCAEATP
jgi:hypothetical protein